jgi:hypothetical protein
MVASTHPSDSVAAVSSNMESTLYFLQFLELIVASCFNYIWKVLYTC